MESNFTYSFSGSRNQFGEFVVRCYKNGKRYPDGDYHTNDIIDANKTLSYLNRQSNASKASQ